LVEQAWYVLQSRVTEHMGSVDNTAASDADRVRATEFGSTIEELLYGPLEGQSVAGSFLTRRLYRRQSGRKAWLVTWESAGDHGWEALTVSEAERIHRVAAILSPRLSVPRVADMVTLLYARAAYTLREQAHYATTRGHKPYPARQDPWWAYVTCGHNPWLYARVVSNLRPETDDPRSVLIWDEPLRDGQRLAPGSDVGGVTIPVRDSVG
jgi:hypothetical protein